MKLTGKTIKLADLKTAPKKPISKAREKVDKLQLELLRVQQALFQQQKRAIILMEGTDTAGKGGVIRRLTRHMDPRGVHVWPIGAPAEWEQSRHYLYRFWQKLPEPGEITVFDRTWYGRVLVERVEGYAEQNEWKRAYNELVEFERQLVDDGVIMIKLFLNLSKEAQGERLLARVKEPTKRWKITISDMKSRLLWDDYKQAYEDMLNKTATKSVPWYVVGADDKEHARVKCLTIIRDELQEHLDLSKVNMLDPEVMAAVIEQFGEGVFKSLLRGSDGKVN